MQTFNKDCYGDGSSMGNSRPRLLADNVLCAQRQQIQSHRTRVGADDPMVFRACAAQHTRGRENMPEQASDSTRSQRL